MSETSARGAFPSADEAFAAAIRAKREAKGLTQEDLAKHMTMRGFDFHQQTIYKIEKGSRKVTVGEAVSLAEAVGVPVETLADQFPGSPESLANEVRHTGRDYAEALFDTVEQMRTLKYQRLAYTEALRLYSEQPTAWVDDTEGNKVPLDQIWAPLALFAGIGDYSTAWNELLSDYRVQITLKAVGWDPEDMDDEEKRI